MRTTLTRTNQRPSLWDFMNEMDQVFSGGFLTDRPQGERAPYFPAVDIVEREGHFLISADLPGLKREDIHLDINDGVLTLSGERIDEKESSGKHYRRYEKQYGKFVRSFRLPENTNPEAIEAAFADGVLEVMIPKNEKVLPKKIEVKPAKEGLLSKILGKNDTEEKH